MPDVIPKLPCLPARRWRCRAEALQQLAWAMESDTTAKAHECVAAALECALRGATAEAKARLVAAPEHPLRAFVCVLRIVAGELEWVARLVEADDPSKE